MFGRRSTHQHVAEASNTIQAVTPPPTEALGQSNASLSSDDEKSGKFSQDYLEKITQLTIDRIDTNAVNKLSQEEIAFELEDIVLSIIKDDKLNLSKTERAILVKQVHNNIFGLGPLESLLKDPSVADIMVNGPESIFIEKNGKIVKTGNKFYSKEHVLNVAQRIVTAVGRRVDESSPICDARLADGSRVNVVAPPLAIDGCSISIRKFSQSAVSLDKLVEYGSLNILAARLLKVAANCRLNIVVSGGTGSGKTTLLNALSRNINENERIVTIEDAAELQLQQPHVVRLETRPASIEGTGEITMRDLVKNALRMRPDRIICGEVRGPEAIDMLQAMNTGHDGSMCTLHANNPREALTRLETMVLQGSVAMPLQSIRSQIATSVNLIVHGGRLRDGSRKVLGISEVVGIEEGVISMQDLVVFKYQSQDGKINSGEHIVHPVRPRFYDRASYFGLAHVLDDVLAAASSN